MIYSQTQRYDECEEILRSFLEKSKRLVRYNPSAFEADLADIESDLTFLYRQTKRYEESSAMYTSALNRYIQLADYDPFIYNPYLARVQMDFANLYFEMQQFNDSETLFKSALQTYKSIAEYDPSAHLAELADTQANLGNLYATLKRNTDSELLFKSALDTYRRLANYNPSVFEPNLARILNNLAILYNDTGRYAESEALYNSSLEIYDRIAYLNPLAYEPEIAGTQMNQAINYCQMERYEKSKPLLDACTPTFKHLYDSYPLLYLKELANCYYLSGYVGYYLKSNKENPEVKDEILFLENFLSLATELRKESRRIEFYEECLFLLSNLYFIDGDYSSAYHLSEEAIPIYKKGYLEDIPDGESQYLALLIIKSCSANLLGKFKEGELIALEILAIDNANYMAEINYAFSSLFQGNVQKAINIMLKYKSDLKKDILEIFAEFERLGVIPAKRKADFQRIKAMLN